MYIHFKIVEGSRYSQIAANIYKHNNFVTTYVFPTLYM